ncbi:MAG: hypothetical protein WAQ98_23150 [Blastocatellia bacterium]
MSASPQPINLSQISNSTGGTTGFGYEKIVRVSPLKLYSEPNLSIKQPDKPVDDVQQPFSEIIAELLISLIDEVLATNKKESIEVYKILVEVLQKRISENTVSEQKIDEIDEQDNYYEKHEKPEIVDAFLHFIETAPIVSKPKNLSDDEIDLF